MALFMLLCSIFVSDCFSCVYAASRYTHLVNEEGLELSSSSSNSLTGLSCDPILFVRKRLCVNLGRFFRRKVVIDGRWEIFRAVLMSFSAWSAALLSFDSARRMLSTFLSNTRRAAVCRLPSVSRDPTKRAFNSAYF